MPDVSAIARENSKSRGGDEHDAAWQTLTVPSSGLPTELQTSNIVANPSIGNCCTDAPNFASGSLQFDHRFCDRQKDIAILGDKTTNPGPEFAVLMMLRKSKIHPLWSSASNHAHVQEAVLRIN